MRVVVHTDMTTNHVFEDVVRVIVDDDDGTELELYTDRVTDGVVVKTKDKLPMYARASNAVVLENRQMF